MGYLEIPLSLLTNFSKAVISIWFRVPAATFTTVNAISDTLPIPHALDTMCNPVYDPPMFKTIPLITFGSIEIDTDTAPCQPSFIGIDCYGGHNCLSVNLQTATHASSTTDLKIRPECFYMKGRSVVSDQKTTVSADTWHHALISFDISGSQSSAYESQSPAIPFQLASTNSFTWALDDVSRVNNSMNPSGSDRWTANGITDPTTIISQGMIDYMSFPGLGDTNTGSIGACHIASSGNPIGAPSSAGFIANIYKIELAELQIFTGVTIDASVEINRRAFITADGSPANMSLAEALIGQPPDIKLHGTNNWKAGLNTGSLSTTFTPTGTITAFSTAPDISP